MDEKDFKKYLACGLGRCYFELKNCADKEPFRTVVLECCLVNPCYDTQSEGTRAEYLYGLLKLFNDDGYFLSPVIEKFNGLEEEYGWEFEHLCDLITEFAKDGNLDAAKTLDEMFDKLYAVLLDRKDFDGYDACRNRLERVSINLASIFDLEKFIKIAEDLGNLFLKNPRYSGWDFDFFYMQGEEFFGKERLKEIEKNESNSRALNEFFTSVNQALSPFKTTEKSQLVREYAPTNPNYDVEALTKKLYSVTFDKDDEGDWHEVVYDLLDSADFGTRLPKSTLNFIYENSLCSCCRKRAVELMKESGFLTGEIRRECLCDSNADIRKLFKLNNHD